MTINVDDIETEIRQAKNQIRSAGGDLKQGFAALDSLIDAVSYTHLTLPTILLV